MITIDDFQKLDLRVATVIAAEKVENADKLLKLSLNVGDESRQILSAIADSFLPEELVGRQVVVVFNLEPKVMRGIESQGMLLAVDTEERTVLLTPNREVAPGSKVS